MIHSGPACGQAGCGMRIAGILQRHSERPLWYNDEGIGSTQMELARITFDPKQMGGLPCIRHLRIPVATVVEMVAQGMSEKEILDAYPDLEAEDIREALTCRP